MNQFLKYLSLLLFSSLMVACSGKKKGEEVAKTFLNAYYIEFDFKTAKELSSEKTKPAILYKEHITELNPYAKEFVPTLEFGKISKQKGTKNNFIFNYKTDGENRTLLLEKIKGQWLVSQEGNIEGDDSFGSSATGGFASAQSGPVIYKERK